jgi:hypothetical protein
VDRQQSGRIIYGIGAIVAPVFIALAVTDGNWLSVALYSGIAIWLWGGLLAGNHHPRALAIVRFLSGIAAMSVLVAMVAYYDNWAIGGPSHRSRRFGAGMEHPRRHVTVGVALTTHRIVRVVTGSWCEGAAGCGPYD